MKFNLWDYLNIFDVIHLDYFLGISSFKKCWQTDGIGFTTETPIIVKNYTTLFFQNISSPSSALENINLLYSKVVSGKLIPGVFPEGKVLCVRLGVQFPPLTETQANIVLANLPSKAFLAEHTPQLLPYLEVSTEKVLKEFWESTKISLSGIGTIYKTKHAAIWASFSLVSDFYGNWSWNIGLNFRFIS